MITIREARESDADGICVVFRSTYGDDYAYPQYYEPYHIKKMIFSDETVMFVAEDEETGQIVGTSSVILEIGAFSDLVSEFGRLAVLPSARGKNLGTRLMQARLDYVRNRNHICLSETRVTHPFSTRIGLKHGFKPLGFLPQKLLVTWRESAAVMVQYFGHALELRRNHPRIVPEVYQLASRSLRHVDLPNDLIIDEESPSYPYCDDYTIEDMTQEGYARLLRFERGRVRNREIFGPGRLHYGFMRLQAKRSHYLIAREGDLIVGAVGFMHDTHEHVVRVFELISLDDRVIRFLLAELERRCREDMQVAYVEIDVSAYAPRMQRTLHELNFVPAAYIPAMAFHHVERLDIVKMIRLIVPLDLGPINLLPEIQEVADIVVQSLRIRTIVPRIEEAIDQIQLFDGLTHEQRHRIATFCKVARYDRGTTLFQADSPSENLYMILNGTAGISFNGSQREVLLLYPGDCLGELSLVTAESHSATAYAKTEVEVAVLPKAALQTLIRQRPLIGVTLYRNLARTLARKLRATDKILVQAAEMLEH